MFRQHGPGSNGASSEFGALASHLVVTAIGGRMAVGPLAAE